MIASILLLIVLLLLVSLGSYVSLGRKVKKHKKYAIAFGLLGLIGVVTTIYNQIQLDQAQKALSPFLSKPVLQKTKWQYLKQAGFFSAKT